MNKEFLERISQLSPKKLALLAMELQSKLESSQQIKSEPVAIIGMGCRFPGGANSPDAYWKLLSDGVDAITEIPKSRWDIDKYYDPDPETPGKMATRWGGFVDGVDQFDPQFFGISPREAISMDPQQRLLLEVTWEALEHAGYSPDGLYGSSTGVFVGICNNDYFQLLLSGDTRDIDAYLATGSAFSIASGRLSYVLGLQGPSLSVDTACSSSLVAVHLAIQSLRNKECKMALAAGVNLILGPEVTLTLSQAKMMASDGRCKAFDARADGFVRSEGCGVIALKLLSDATRDGDNILAVIRGSAINQDGRSNGITAPNGPSQEAVIQAALADGRVNVEEVGYIESHGTGTSLGDPIEVQALGNVLKAGHSAEDPVMIGSVKTNLGHLESAAGIAGVIKLVLALQHQEIPPHLHLHELSPHIAWQDYPLVIPTRRTPWTSKSGRLIGGISSFGFSGTNVHMILENAAASNPIPNRMERPAHIFTLSAKTEPALHDLSARFEQYLESNPSSSIADVSYTTNVGRAHSKHRLAIVANDLSQVRQELIKFNAGEKSSNTSHGHMQGTRPPEIVFMFTGQGAQYAEMGRQLYETQPTFRAVLDKCDQLLQPYLKPSLLSVLFSNNEVDKALIDQTAYTQPALFSIEYALATLWQSWGIEPTVVMGHSVGEYVAACVAGVFSLEDGLKLIAERGRLMQQLPSGGAMVAVFADQVTTTKAISNYSNELSIAAINGPTNVVISGADTALSAVLGLLGKQGIKSQRLTVSCAFHSPLMDPILDEFQQIASGVTYNQPRMGLFSNLTGDLLASKEVINPSYWREHARQPVRFADSMTALKNSGYDTFLEIGPTPTLLSMGQRCLPENFGTWLPSLRKGQEDWQQLLNSLARLYTIGVAVDWKGFERDYAAARRRYPLPTYPFQRNRYWVTNARPTFAHVDKSLHPLLGAQLRSPVIQDIVFETKLSAGSPAFLSHHRVFDLGVLPASGYIEMALRGGAKAFGTNSCTIKDLKIVQAMILPEDDLRTVQLIITPGEGHGNAAFRILSLAKDQKEWILHATGNLESESVSSTRMVFDLEGIQARCLERISGEEYYDQVYDLGLEFGPDFHGSTEAWKGNGEALGLVKLADELAPESILYGIHPALLDACFHSLSSLWNDNESAHLPVSIDRFQLYGVPGTKLWSHAKVQSENTLSQGAAKGDICLFDENGNLVAEIEGLSLLRVEREVFLQSVESTSDDWLYQVNWKLKSLPDEIVNHQTATFPQSPSVEQLSRKTSELGPWLIFTDNTEVGLQLGEILKQREEKCIFVSCGDEYKALAANHWQINPSTPEDFEKLLDETGGQLRNIIHLWSLENSPADLSPSLLESAHTRNCGSALHLVQALAKQSHREHPRIWLVTKDAQPIGASGVSTSSIAQAPLWGFGRVIALEHPELWGGLIDLDPASSSSRDVSQLLSEILQSDGEDQVAWRGEERFVARLIRTNMPVGSNQTIRLEKDGAYLITGGLGGLGLKLAHWLAEQGARHLVLIGRHGLPEKDSWSALSEDDPAREQIAALQAIEALGTTVCVESADVSDLARMSEIIQRFGKSMPALRGIIHAAADLSNWKIKDLPLKTLQSMLKPKVTGTWILHTLTQEIELDFFILFSSTSALIGASDLGHYAAANHFLDGFAHYRHNLGLPALSINWGTWDKMRVASARDKERVAEFGLQPMPSERALKILGQLSGSALPQITVAAVDWNKLKPVYGAKRDRPFLAEVGPSEIETKRKFAKNEPGDKSVFLQKYTNTRPADRAEVLTSFIQTEVSQVLGLNANQSPDLHQGLFEMGLDSLMAIELKNHLEAGIAQSLPSTLIFNYPTIADLADFLNTRLSDVSEKAKPEPDSKQKDPSTPIPGIKETVKTDDLSEDELALLLTNKLKGLE